MCSLSRRYPTWAPDVPIQGWGGQGGTIDPGVCTCERVCVGACLFVYGRQCAKRVFSLSFYRLARKEFFPSRFARKESFLFRFTSLARRESFLSRFTVLRENSFFPLVLREKSLFSLVLQGSEDS